MAGHRPNQAEVAVGQRIRAFRKEAQLSQTALADQVGVTFQQLQKYEKGTNRVGAGRLAQIARALDVPITAFFDGLARRPTDKQRANTAQLATLTALPTAPKLLKAFAQISDPVLQTNIINLVRALAVVQRRQITWSTGNLMGTTALVGSLRAWRPV
jgi:transcriptional regulator with XRE-family HTH domain